MLRVELWAGEQGHSGEHRGEPGAELAELGSAALAAHPHPCELALAGTGTVGSPGMDLHPGEGLRASGQQYCLPFLF